MLANRVVLVSLAFLTCSIARASIITASATDIFAPSASYTVHIQNGSGNELNSTQFANNTGNKHSIAVSTIETFALSYAPLPGDAIIDSITLDLDLNSTALSVTGQLGAGGYLPSFGATTNTLKFDTVSVTVGANTTTFNVPNNPAPFQIVLPATFYTGILSNEDISIGWQTSTTFVRTTPGNASGKYGTSPQHIHFSLSKIYTASAGLTIDYHQPTSPELSAVPEPGSMSIMGLGIAGLTLIFKLRSRSRRK